MIFALGAAIANTVAATVNKIVLSGSKMPVFTFNIWVFVFLCLFSAIGLPWYGQVDLELALSPYYLFLLLTAVLLASAWNISMSYCLQQKKLSDFQMVSILNPLLSVAMAMIVFSEERNLRILLATGIAGLVLIASHFSRWKSDNTTLTFNLFLTIILAAIESLFLKELLVVYSPVALYFIRTFLISLIYIFSTTKYIFRFNYSQIIRTMIVAFFAVFAMIFSFYSYRILGLAKTSIIMLLYPVSTTIVSVYLLKERIKKRKIVAFVIIILCIIYAFLDSNSIV